jgi:SAM-dependent methyltransferase
MEMTIACQSCGYWPLKQVIDLGYMPAVNAMRKIGETVAEEPFFPTVMAVCEKCELVQLGGPPPDNNKVFPPDYPYTTASSKPLIENFRQLAQEVSELMGITKDGARKLSVCDIGSNDGTLLQKFKDLGHEVIGVEPTDIADRANEKGILTIHGFFNDFLCLDGYEHRFDVVTCCNCFAHMPDVNGVVEGIKEILKPDGIFVSESHYLFDLLRDVQYDTIYHEHLRFYSLRALRNLFDRHGMKIVKAKRISTHGGSIRVYAALTQHPMAEFPIMLGDGALEPTRADLEKALKKFAERVIYSRRMYSEIETMICDDETVVGIGAPSRGAILINYLGLNHNDITCVAERDGSLKIGRFIPGTRIPVVAEDWALEQNPDYALILSWHMADAIMKNWRDKGYKGKFIIPLPEPRIV